MAKAEAAAAVVESWMGSQSSTHGVSACVAQVVQDSRLKYCGRSAAWSCICIIAVGPNFSWNVGWLAACCCNVVWHVLAVLVRIGGKNVIEISTGAHHVTHLVKQ